LTQQASCFFSARPLQRHTRNAFEAVRRRAMSCPQGAGFRRSWSFPTSWSLTRSFRRWNCQRLLRARVRRAARGGINRLAPTRGPTLVASVDFSLLLLARGKQATTATLSCPIPISRALYGHLMADHALRRDAKPFPGCAKRSSADPAPASV